MYVLPSGRRTVAGRLALDLLAFHDPQRIEPAVCFLEDGPLVGECSDRLGMSTAVIPYDRRRWFARRRVIRDLTVHCKALGIRLVHSFSGFGHSVGGRVARKVGIPSVWSQLEQATWRRRRDISAALIKTRAIIAHAPSVKLAQERVNPRRAKCVLFPAGTRLPTEALDSRRLRGRAALGIKPEQFAVGIFGMLEPNAGHEVVLRAAASLVHARANAQLLVSADKGNEHQVVVLGKLAGELGISPNVRILERARDPAAMLAACDVIVDAALQAAELPLAVIEALASGAATVATDHAAVRELVTPGVEAILTAPGDHEALALTLLALCDDPERRSALAAAGTSAARERFDAERMTRRVEALYRDVARA